MAGKKRSTPPVPIGGSGLPNLDNFDYEQTSTRNTETSHSVAPPSRHPSHPVVTVIGGADAGRVVRLRAGVPITIGRATDCDVVLPDAGVSRHHIRLEWRDGTFRIEDLGSKNGTFVDGSEAAGPRETAIGSTIQIGTHVLIRLVMMTDVEEILARQLYDSSMRDPLTGTYNRRFAMDRLHAEISFAVRHHAPLSVGVVDFDHFKAINDQYGHASGDAVLVECAKRIAATLRSEDLLARIGGEEFALVLRGISYEQALACAERVRSAVSARGITLDARAHKVTISVGIASLDDVPSAPTAEKLLAIADERLYGAKRDGRDRVKGRG